MNNKIGFFVFVHYFLSVCSDQDYCVDFQFKRRILRYHKLAENAKVNKMKSHDKHCELLIH